jgi:hypothetical protein
MAETAHRLTVLLIALVLAGCGAAADPAPPVATTTPTTPPTTEATMTETTVTTAPETAGRAEPAGGSDRYQGLGYALDLPSGTVAAESGDLSPGMLELVTFEHLDAETGALSLVASVTEPADTSLAALSRFSALLDTLSAQVEVEEVTRFGLEVDGAADEAEAGEYVTEGTLRRLLMAVELSDGTVLSVMGTCAELDVDTCRPALVSILDSIEVTP